MGFTLGSFTLSDFEMKELLKAWIAISLAVTIALGGLSAQFLLIFALSALTVGIGFLFHELGHKVLAQRYGLKAEFRAFNQMLVLAIIVAFFGFVFAAPGAVMIRQRTTVEKFGKIALMGPVINLILALIFLGIAFIPGLNVLGWFGFLINSWLALFNMLPFWQLDGNKVWAWNKGVAIAVIIIAFGFLMSQGLFRPA